jgi:hypothetical protein
MACFQFVTRVSLTSLMLMALACPTGARDPQAACLCIEKWQTTVLTAKNLETCKDVHGTKCLGFEVRVTKPWTWDATKQTCVGSYLYWEGIQGNNPEWAAAGTYGNMEVSLDRASQRCKEIGSVSNDDPTLTPGKAANLKTTTGLRDTANTGTRISEVKVLRGDERWTIRMQGEETLRVSAGLRQTHGRER